MLVALVNYKVKRKDNQSFSNGTSAEALLVRDRGSNRTGKGESERSKSRPSCRDLKKNRCVFCKEIGYWKVDCPRIKDKNKGKESKAEANLAHVISTQVGTHRQVDRTQTHQYSRSPLLLLLLVTQMILSGY